jgi:hypothetical protein
MPENIKKALFRTARVHQELYDQEKGRRTNFWKRFGIELCVRTCIDDRVDVPCTYFGLPYGTVQPKRSPGGDFTLEEPNVANDAIEFIDYSKRVGRTPTHIGLYHNSDVEERCCAGHRNNTEAAMLSQLRMCRELKDCFGDDGYYFVIGVNTDTDTMRLHTETGDVIDVLDLLPTTTELELLMLVEKGFPSIMDVRVLMFLAHILRGNLDRRIALELNPRTEEEKEHAPDVFAFGWGLQWCRFAHEDSRNGRVIKLAPWKIHNSDDIEFSCEVIRKYARTKQGLLLVSQGYRRGRIELARKQVHRLAEYVTGVIESRFPDWDFLDLKHPCLTVTDLGTMEVTEVT